MNLGSEKALVEFVKDNNNNIYIYGAGVVGQRMVKRFELYGIKISGFIVSEIDDSLNSIMGYPVIGKASIPELVDATVIIGVIGEKAIDILDGLMEFDNIVVITLPVSCYNQMRTRELQDEYNNFQSKYNISFEKPRTEGQMGIISDKKTDEELIRVILYTSKESLKDWSGLCSDDRFEKEYGKLRLLPCFDKSSVANMNNNEVQMYAATTHNDKATAQQISNDGIIPLQVGSALTDIRKGCATDDTGDNISEDNPNYCECTGLYWMYKNTSGQEYIGLDHYRRRLKISAQQLEYIREQGINLVLAFPQFTTMRTKDYFAGRLIAEHDWKNMQEAVMAIDETYAECLAKMDENWFYFSCNLCLMKRDIFDDYCSFAFAVAKVIDTKYKSRGIQRNDRYMGYIFEVLLSLYVMKNYDELKPYCTGVQWVE